MANNFIGFITDKNYDFSNLKQPFGLPSTYIVKRFKVSINKKVTIRVAALGVYSLYVNGHLVNDDFMCQDCSEYQSLIYYRDYDISKFIIEGVNSLGIILSDGWYASNLSNVGKNVFGEYPLKVYFEIYIDKIKKYYSDGSEVAASGAIRSSDNQNGINIDNNYDLGDFSSPNYNLSSFSKVDCFLIDTPLKKSLIKPTLKYKTFKGKIVIKNEHYVIYDFKQNMAGVTETVFSGEKNSKIVLYHAEVLTLDGKDLYTENLRSALAKDTYILKGDKEETFLPRHTFHGFRYVKVVIEGQASLKSIKAIAITTKQKRVGYIKTNNPLVNKIYKNVLWGQKDNFISIPTDCPQRDERMGWTGDAQVFTPTACFNFNSHNFLKKYVIDMMTSIDKYGDDVPVVIPYFYARYGIPRAVQGWSDAIIIIPYYLYLYYDDKSLLNKAYPYMQRYIRYLEKNKIKDHLIKDDSFAFGDWLSVNETMDKDVYNNLFLVYNYLLMSKIASILSKKEQPIFNDNYLLSKAAFKNKFIVDGFIKSDTQGCYVLAYNFTVLTLEEIKDNLIRKIKQFNHLTTGFHSTKFLLPTLCDMSCQSLAYDLLLSKKYPSWGYEIVCGATTIWERWDSYKIDTGFNDDGMNSFNHYSLGSVVQWMYAYMLGIKPNLESPAFKKVIISPYFDVRVNKVKGKYLSKNGLIEINYSIKDNKVSYEIKADKNITLDFKFNNKIIEAKDLGDNHFAFLLKY